MRALLAIVALFTVGCVTQSTIARENAATAQLTHALNEYITAHPRRPYPTTKEQLLAFAAVRSIPLDLSWVTAWQHMHRDTLVVWYHSEAVKMDKYIVFSTNPI